MDTSNNNVLEAINKSNQYPNMINSSEAASLKALSSPPPSSLPKIQANRFGSLMDTDGIKLEMTASFSDGNMFNKDMNKHQINDTKNIDNLARQFKESTHNYAFGNNNNNNNNSDKLAKASNFTEQFISRSTSCPNHFENNNNNNNAISLKISNNSMENMNNGNNESSVNAMLASQFILDQGHNNNNFINNKSEPNRIIGIISGDSDLSGSIVFPISNQIQQQQQQQHQIQLQQQQQQQQQQQIQLQQLQLQQQFQMQQKQQASPIISSANNNENNNHKHLHLECMNVELAVDSGKMSAKPTDSGSLDNNNFMNNSNFLQNKLNTLNAQINKEGMFLSNEILLNCSVNNNNNTNTSFISDKNENSQ